MPPASSHSVGCEFGDQEARAILDSITDGFIVLDEAWRIVYINSEAARINQKPAEAFLGKIIWEEWPGLVGSPAEQRYRDAVRNQSAIHVEYHYVGGIYDLSLEIHGYPFKKGLALFYRDITERKQAEVRSVALEEQLKRKVEDFETLFKSMPVGVAVSEDPECRTIRGNPAFAQMLGIAIEENASKSGPDAERLPFRVHGKGRELRADELPQQTAQREARAVHAQEIEVVHDDGRVCSMYGSAAPLFDDSGAVRGSIAAYVDLTDRKLAMEALQESEERYRSLVSATSALVWTADPNGEFSPPQPTWSVYTGQSRQEYKGFGWTEALHPEDRERAWRIWTAAVERRQQYDTEYRIWHAASSEFRRCHIRAAPVLRDDGSVREWIGAVTDVHDRKLFETELQRKDKLESLGILAGGVAHDFNNLLVGVMGGASLAMDMVGPEVRPILEGVVHAAERGADLTRQMLAYAGKGQFVLQRLDLSEEVRAVVALLRSSVNPNARIELDLRAGLPAVNADRGQIQQIIMNLVINAGEALPTPGGRIRVATGARGGDDPMVEMSVEDDGAGMTPDVKARIFDPFFTTKFTGRGLGLAAVMGIVHAHGGSIAVDTLTGRGTTFRVLLPAAEEAPALSVPVVGTSVAKGTARGSVLVVDDELLVRRVAKMSFDRSGIETLLAINGEEAIAIFRELGAEIDLVILDATMPGLGGRDVFCAIRSIRATVPIVICSGHPECEIERFFAPHTPSGYLAKPFRPAALIALAREWIAKKAETGSPE